MSQRSPRSELKTIRFPSGDHAGSTSSQSPSVTCRVSSPSRSTTKTCLRRSVVQPTLSSLYRRRVSRRGARFLSSSSSYASSRTRIVYASRVESGDQTTSSTPSFASVSAARLAALGRDDVELRRRLLVAAVRREREPAAVGRPARRAVALLAGGESARLRGAVERRRPRSRRGTRSTRGRSTRPGTRRGARRARCAGRRRLSARRCHRAACLPRAGLYGRCGPVGMRMRARGLEPPRSIRSSGT